MKFSERYGLKPIKNTIQIDHMDHELRNSLWNAIYVVYFSPGRLQTESAYLEDLRSLAIKLWLDFFKTNIGSLRFKAYDIITKLHDYYLKANWNEIYDLIEFIAQNYPNVSINEQFINLCNDYLKRELSAYRFVGKKISRVSSEEEINEIEEALKIDDVFIPVKNHIKSAIDLFSDKNSPDYKNSIKESISAVESMCKLITQNKKAVLSDALKVIEKEGNLQLHPALKIAFDKMYGYTSDADGIRHGSGLLDEPKLDFEDAKFFLVACSAFINYLKEKLNKTNLKIKNLD